MRSNQALKKSKISYKKIIYPNHHISTSIQKHEVFPEKVTPIPYRRICIYNKNTTASRRATKVLSVFCSILLCVFGCVLVVENIPHNLCLAIDTIIISTGFYRYIVSILSHLIFPFSYILTNLYYIQKYTHIRCSINV